EPHRYRNGTAARGLVSGVCRLLANRRAGVLAIEANDLAVNPDVALGLDPKLAGQDAGIPPALEVQTFFRVDLEPPAMERDRVRRLDLEAGAPEMDHGARLGQGDPHLQLAFSRADFQLLLALDRTHHDRSSGGQPTRWRGRAWGGFLGLGDDVADGIAGWIHRGLSLSERARTSS